MFFNFPKTLVYTYMLFSLIIQGWYFGLTKVLLAEGDAPFPFVGHCSISLRRTLLLRKTMMLAQRDRENSRKKNSDKINVSKLSHSISVAIMNLAIWVLRMKLIIWAGEVCLIMEFSHWKHACVLAGANVPERALAKGWLDILCPAKKWDVMKIKPIHARVRSMR